MFTDLTIKSRLIFVIGTLSLLLVGSGVVGLSSLGAANESLKALYETRLVPMGRLDAVVRLIDKNRMAVAESANGDPAAVAKAMDDVERRIDDVGRLWTAYASVASDPEEKALADRFAASRKKFVDEGLKPAVAALRVQNTQMAMELMQTIRPRVFFSSMMRAASWLAKKTARRLILCTRSQASSVISKSSSIGQIPALLTRMSRPRLSATSRIRARMALVSATSASRISPSPPASRASRKASSGAPGYFASAAFA